jgi:hypothetical protein
VTALWGAIAAAIGVLVLVGSAVPWLETLGEPFAFTDDLSSSWPLLSLGVLAVLGGIDGLRGSTAGPGIAAGAGGILVLVQVMLLRIVAVSSDYVDIAIGGLLWTLAALASVGLIAAALVLAVRDRRGGRAPGWASGVVTVGGVIWLVGVVVPDRPGLTVADHLLGGDTWSDGVNIGLLAFTVAMLAVAALVRSRAAYGLAAGTMGFWTVAWVTAASGYRASAEGFVSYLSGSFAPFTVGTLVATAGACLGVLLSRDRTTPASRRAVVPASVVAGLACLPVVAVFGLVRHADDDRLAVADGWEREEVPDDYGADGVPPEMQPGGSVNVICTDLVESSIESAWQDLDGAIHVVILVDNACASGQVLDDPEASFAITSGGVDVAAADFDFAAAPVAVPAYGSSTAELVFRPESFVDLEELETVGLGGEEAASGASAVGLRYSYTCTDEPDASSTSAGPVVGDATAAPIVPTNDGEAEALARLSEISAADAPYIESSVIEAWVPQISSKRPDVPLPDGSIWTAEAILEDHRSRRIEFPRVRLIWSGNYTSYTSGDFWVTIVAIPYATPDEANAWCDANAQPLEDCYAKLISHAHAPEGSTHLR